MDAERSFEDFEDADLRKVTILFYGLGGGDEIISRLQRVWKETKPVTY